MLHKLRYNKRALKFVSSIEKDPYINLLLAKLKVHHEDTYNHSVRVAMLAVDVGLENGLSKEDLYLVACGALLHDIGKLKIDLNILAKKGSLTPEERQVIREHPRLGFNMLADEDYSEARKIVVAHHEYSAIDSYPRKYLDTTIPSDIINRRVYNPKIDMLTQMVAVVDMMDALLNVRGYKPEFSPDKVKEILPHQFRGDRKFIIQAMDRM